MVLTDMRWMLALLLCSGFASAQTPKKPAAKPVPKPPAATDPATMKVAKDFKVELLYTVPDRQYGSWVNLCVDPKGRLIVSDQYGMLWRVTPPPLGTAGEPKIEKITADIGEAQGLLWAFDSLYVMVNSGKRTSGLYRVTDSNNDDMPDKVELLMAIKGHPPKGNLGEHGPHAIVPHPDGKRLTIVCGNQCALVPFNTSKVPQVWGEDHLLPRMPDGNGFMAGVLGPGGAIYNITPDGKNWELFSSGFRNQYDAAYDRNGNLFTYDADMEWDFNTPWYRPTRVCQVTSGTDFGWRNGAGKYPAYYLDSVPAIIDVGPGSPTGVCFGYGAKFPKKYQDAFYICDWSYGKLYAVHMTPSGSVHKAELEEFVSGAPLPLTDVVINPVDKAMYFLIGGRKTQSGLYRVTYQGAVMEEITRGGKEMANLRNELEMFHQPDPKGVEAAWPHLGHEDRFVRAAARIALEHQPVAQWKDRALAEKDPIRQITALLALTRVSAACPQHRKPNSPPVDANLGVQIQSALNAIPFDSLKADQRLDLLRVYEVFFNRYGMPPAPGRTATLAKFEPHFPTGNRYVDGELASVLVYLESPKAAPAITAALLKAPTQEEQIEYARSLRVLKTGWTPETRKQYFEWIVKSETYRGGNSFGGFLKRIKDDAVATLTPQERAQYKNFIEAQINPKALPKAAPRKLVKEYKFDDVLPVIEKGLAAGGRNYENGRQMFAAATCASCHRFDEEGGRNGPDLTQLAGRFSVRDILVSIMDPNKEISDQYAAVEIETEDGRKIIGRIANLNGDTIKLVTNMLDPGNMTDVKRDNVASMKTAKQSMMPTATLDTLKEDEIIDLMAYLISRGDRNHAVFKKK